VPADHVQVAAGVGADLRGHAQRVGRDDELAAAAQVLDERERRRSPVDEQHAAVLDELGGGQADLLLLIGLEPGAVVEPRVVPGDRRVRHGAPVGADDEPLGVELVQIAADGVGGDGEVLGEGGDGHLPVLGDVLGDVGLAAGRESGCIAHGSRVADLCAYVPFVAGALSKGRSTSARSRATILSGGMN
jgi:hypothetical protein